MPWTMQMIDRPKAVAVKATGPMKLVLITQLAAEALGEAARHGVHKFFVDDRDMEPELSTLEIYELPDTLGRMGLGMKDRVAVVYDAASAKAADFRFFEHSARNRGYDIRLFTDAHAALGWLGQPDP